MGVASANTLDVFTDTLFGGNPLAVVFGAESLKADRMQAIAAEFNLSETAFVLPAVRRTSTRRVRIFTPRAELAFAGSTNGILIVEFTNQLRRKGVERVEAVIEASTLRLRPILMTALATVLGATPLALSSGAGAEARQAIGWVIVGGISLGTLLTLFIIPVAYTLIVRNIHLIPEERDAAEMAAGAGVITSPQSKQH